MDEKSDIGKLCLAINEGAKEFSIVDTNCKRLDTERLLVDIYDSYKAVRKWLEDQNGNDIEVYHVPTGIALDSAKVIAIRNNSYVATPHLFD